MCAALSGCGGGADMTGFRSAPVRARQVRVDWLGHESFLFTSSLGTKILTNPFANGTGGRSFPKNLKPDILLVSSERADANNVDAVENSPTTFRGAVGMGPNNAAGITIRGVPTFKNPEHQTPEDMNLAFVWRQDGVRFCFLGNIERALTPAEAQQIGFVDVLFLPVGVPAGLSNDERRIIVGQLQPRVIVPMGRGAEFSEFASGFPSIHRLPGSSVLLSQEFIPPGQTVLVFSAP